MLVGLSLGYLRQLSRFFYALKDLDPYGTKAETFFNMLVGIYDPNRIEPRLIKQCKNNYIKVFMREVGEGMHDDEYKVELQGENIVAVKI